MMSDSDLKVEESKSRTEHLADHLTEYVETYLKLAAIKATEKGTGVATVTLIAIVLSVICLFVLLFVGLGIAIWLGESWGNMKAGYFTVGGFYTFCALLFVVLRKSFILPLVRDHLIRKVYE